MQESLVLEIQELAAALNCTPQQSPRIRNNRRSPNLTMTTYHFNRGDRKWIIGTPKKRCSQSM